MLTDRETLEMAEARELAYSYFHHARKSGEEAARDWLKQALVVSMKRYGGAEALMRIRGYMTRVKTEEMGL